MSSPELPELRSAELLAALLGHAVQFLVVGGIGAQLHGATLAAVLNELDARLDLPPDVGDLEIRPSTELLARTSMTRWLTRAGVLDVLQEIPAGEHSEPRGYADLSQTRPGSAVPTPGPRCRQRRPGGRARRHHRLQGACTPPERPRRLARAVGPAPRPTRAVTNDQRQRGGVHSSRYDGGFDRPH